MHLRMTEASAQSETQLNRVGTIIDILLVAAWTGDASQLSQTAKGGVGMAILHRETSTRDRERERER